MRKSSKKEEAKLVEIVSRETSEVGTSSRRRKKAKILRNTQQQWSGYAEKNSIKKAFLMKMKIRACR